MVTLLDEGLLLVEALAEDVLVVSCILMNNTEALALPDGEIDDDGLPVADADADDEMDTSLSATVVTEALVLAVLLTVDDPLEEGDVDGDVEPEELEDPVYDIIIPTTVGELLPLPLELALAEAEGENCSPPPEYTYGIVIHNQRSK